MDIQSADDIIEPGQTNEYSRQLPSASRGQAGLGSVLGKNQDTWLHWHGACGVGNRFQQLWHRCTCLVHRFLNIQRSASRHFCTSRGLLRILWKDIHWCQIGVNNWAVVWCHLHLTRPCAGVCCDDLLQEDPPLPVWWWWVRWHQPTRFYLPCCRYEYMY